MTRTDPPLWEPAAARLSAILTQTLPSSGTLDQIATQVHRGAPELARPAAARVVQLPLDAAERAAPTGPGGQRLRAEPRRPRSILRRCGLIQRRLRRYHCPRGGVGRAPGAERRELTTQQRLTRGLQEVVCQFGGSWSYAVAAGRLARVLPGAAVSAKTVERAPKRSPESVQGRSKTPPPRRRVSHSRQNGVHPRREWPRRRDHSRRSRSRCGLTWAGLASSSEAGPRRSG